MSLSLTNSPGVKKTFWVSIWAIAVVANVVTITMALAAHPEGVPSIVRSSLRCEGDLFSVAPEAILAGGPLPQQRGLPPDQ